MFAFTKKQKIEKRLRVALADGILTEGEFDDIIALKNLLRIDDSILYDLRTKYYLEQIGPVLKTIEQSGRFSPDEEKRCRAIAEGMKIDFHAGPTLQKASALWRLEFEQVFEPPVIESSIRLGKSEQCYLSCDASWFQNKTRKINLGYVGGSVGVRVAKGITIRVGRAVPISTTVEGFEKVSDGILYVTNKKILFVGTRRSTNITMSRLVDYHLFSNGIEIKKTSGAPDFFELQKLDLEYLDALLQVI